MSFTVKRSPGRVCWWVCCNDIMLTTADTKAEAEALAAEFTVKYA